MLVARSDWSLRLGFGDNVVSMVRCRVEALPQEGRPAESTTTSCCLVNRATISPSPYQPINDSLRRDKFVVLIHESDQTRYPSIIVCLGLRDGEINVSYHY